MSGTGYRKKWLRAGKVLEYYIDGGPWANSIRDAEYQLYHAVIDGEIRVQLDGKPFQYVSELRGKSFSDDRSYVLPFDLELNIEDVERIWDWSKYDIADLLARNLVRPVSAEMRMETSNLNIRVLLERVRVRLAAMPLEKALEEIEFDSRWASLVREQDLLIGSNLIERDRFSELLAEYVWYKSLKEQIVDGAAKPQSPSGVRGRKATYDWAAVSDHIAAQFEHHGPLSPDDPQWCFQADVEREIQRFFAQKIGREPAISTTREKAKAMIERHMAGNSPR